MKKIKLLLLTLFLTMIMPHLVWAASGSISVTGTSQVVIGNKVTLTVTLSSATKIGSWQMQLNYDKSYLQLTSSSAEAGGTVMASSSSSGVKSQKYTFTFKALKKGSTTVSIGSYEAYAYDDFSEISLSSSGKTLKIITQEELEASYSKDNNLKSLSIEGFEISPEFNKDTLDYTVTVPEGTTSINVIATPNDSKSSITGDGTIEVTEGANNLKIVVRAENGSEKVYNIVVNVIDANPINVKVGTENYTVIKLRSNYTCPELYSDSEVEISGVKVPSCYNEKVKYTLVGLKKEDGTVESFIYNNGKYTKYNEVIGTSLKIIILDSNEEIPGLTKATSMIDGESYAVSTYEGNKDYYVVYGMNVATGEKNYYLYDAVNKTFTLYNNDQVESLIKTNRNYLYIIIAFGIGLFLSLVCMLSLIIKKKDKKKEVVEEKIVEEKPKKKTTKKKKEEEKELEENIIKEEVNEIQEVVNNDDTDTYYLFDSDRKKSKKRHEKENLDKM